MAIFRNRIVAIFIMVVTVFMALLYGGGNTATGLRAQAVELYQQGDMGDGMGVAYDLIRVADHSYNLLTVARRYLPEEDGNLTAMQEAHDAFESDPGVLYLQQLLTTARELSLILAELPLSERDEDYRVSCYVNMLSHARIIRSDAYNTVAGEYNRRIKSFPLSVFGGRPEPLLTYEILEVQE